MLGSRFALSFSLPRAGTLSLDVEVTYQLIPDLGLTFLATSPSDPNEVAADAQATAESTEK